MVRKLTVRHACTFIFVCIIFIIGIHVFGQDDVNNRNKMYVFILIFIISLDISFNLFNFFFFFYFQIKSDLIEQSIHSIVNQGKCQLPDIPYDSPEMLAFLKTEPPIDCGNELDDWVSCQVCLFCVFSFLEFIFTVKLFYLRVQFVQLKRRWLNVKEKLFVILLKLYVRLIFVFIMVKKIVAILFIN